MISFRVWDPHMFRYVEQKRYGEYVLFSSKLVCEFWTGNQCSRRRLPRERNSKSAATDCWMYYLQDTRIQVHYNWQVANWRRASKLSSFLKRNTLFDVSVEYLMEHSYALCFIVHARLYLYRILPTFPHLPTLSFSFAVSFIKYYRIV